MRPLIASLLLACAPISLAANDVTVSVWNGEATVESAPEKVVAFDLAAIDTLNALGVDLDGVPAFGPPAFLEEAMTGVETMGTLFEPDLEKLAILGPDLIVAGGRSQDAVETLGAIASTIDMTINGDALIEQSKARTLAYGKIFEKEAEAEALISALDAKLAEVNEVTAGKGGALILMTNGGKLSAYGAGSRFGWLHTAAGIEQAHSEISAENHGESVSFEFIAEVNPEWILVVDRLSAIGRDGEAAAVTLDNPLVAGTAAGQKGQFIYMDSAPLYLAAGGANAIQLLLDQVIDGFSKAGS